ncbi:MAG TPA: C39 family peptidase [Chloroflexota bacterium]
MRLFVRSVAMLLLAAGVWLPTRSAAQSGPLILTGFPVLRQQHNLTCESSAVSMATRGQIVESQLMAAMPRNPNPNVGFRGNPDGFQGTKLIDYGVYAGPLHLALARFGYNSDEIYYGTDRDIKSYISRGWPVVAWVTYNLQKATPRLGAFNGIQFVLVPHEHAVTILGYDNHTVIFNDPWTRTQVRHYWRDFNRSWGYFGNMALAVEPCAAALPVQRIQVASVSATSITWTWAKAANAAHYSVSVTRYGAKSHVEFNGTQDATQFTINNPFAGQSYEISVRSVSFCGDLTSPTTLWTQLPAALPTPTPSATESTATTPTTTPTPTALPTSTPTVTATAKP